jgi:hypothetical protein
MRRHRAAVRGGAPDSPDRVREMRAWLAENGARPDLDVLAEGSTPDGERLGGLADRWTVGGCRLHLVDGEHWEMPHHSKGRMEEVRRRLVAGPPTVGR